MRPHPFHRPMSSCAIRGLAAVALPALALALVASGCGSSSNSKTNPPGRSPAGPAATSTPQTSTGGSGASSSGGSSSQAAPSGAGAKLDVAANPSGQFSYEPSSLSTKAGAVTVEFTNSSQVEHNLTVAGPSGTVDGATPTFTGGTKALSLNLKPGTYKFYCTVPGHRAAGMEGTLVVR